MKVIDLKEALNKLKISTSAYHLHGPGTGEGYCIEHGPSGWSVYYHERGSKNIIEVFENEDVACDFFIKTLLDDPTTRSK
jgi:hypothetical protein